MTVFRLHAIPAEEGDCLVVTYGPSEDDLARIVVDGGHTATQTHLKKHLKEAGAKAIDLLVVTHVDADHIEGMLGMLGSDGPFKNPTDVWFNGYRHLVEDLESFGPVQGETLTTELLKQNWNLAMGGGAVRLEDDGTPRRLPDLRHGMKVTVLSPSRKKLRAMERTWKSACAEAGLVPGKPATKTATLPGNEAFGADLKAIAATATKRDTAAANGTSIALLLEFAGRRLVLGADAHPDVLTDSLRRLGDGEPLHVDLFKLPHHGSQANVTVDLLKAVRCSDYVVSTNGKRFNHPDEIAIARVITSSVEQKTIWFNYRQDRTECWIDDEASAKYAFSCEFPKTGDEPLEIDILSLGPPKPDVADV